MNFSKHFMARSRQRGICESLINLAMTYGHEEGDRIILSTKRIKQLMHENDLARKNLIKASDKGGIVLVTKDDTLITTYALSK